MIVHATVCVVPFGLKTETSRVKKGKREERKWGNQWLSAFFGQPNRSIPDRRSVPPSAVTLAVMEALVCSLVTGTLEALRRHSRAEYICSTEAQVSFFLSLSPSHVACIENSGAVRGE